MNDPIKKFVEQHREAFDHMEPPAAVLDQIKSRLKAKAEEEKKANLKKTEERKIVPLFSRAKWAVAASILFAVTTTYFFYNGKGNHNASTNVALQSAPKIKQGSGAENTNGQKKEQSKQLGVIEKIPESTNQIAKNQPVERSSRTVSDQNFRAGQNVAENHNISESQNGFINKKTSDIQLDASKKKLDRQSIQDPAKLNMATKELYARLNDSTSSTVRLSAILELNKNNSINKNTLNSLAKTLNNDSNSNVRLAALEVMGQYANNKHVSSLLVSSFSTQNDPLVQLGLIGLIGKIDNVKVEDRLFALADDPNTLGVVKDEAYLALLNQNKL